MIRIAYDMDVDVLLIHYRHAPVAYSEEVEEGVIIDYDGEGRIVSVEILNLSKREHVKFPMGVSRVFSL